MERKKIYKGVDCPNLFLSVFPDTNYSVSDVPFSLRRSEVNKINLDNLPFDYNDDDESLVLLDKFYFMFSALLRADKNILKHLNLIMMPAIKYCDLVADYIIIRHNRVLLVEFCYDLTCNKSLDLKENKVTFISNKLENTLKKYLPIDTIVNTHMFYIRKGTNDFEIDRLAKIIDDFYVKTTNKELLKLLK